LGGPQSRSGRYGEKKNLELPGIEPNSSVVQPLASRYADCAIPATIFVQYYYSIFFRMEEFVKVKYSLENHDVKFISYVFPQNKTLRKEILHFGVACPKAKWLKMKLANMKQRFTS
jgi:hypothetical protein